MHLPNFTTLRRLLLATLISGSWLSAADDKATVAPIQQWSGSLEDRELQAKAPPVITDATALGKLWQDWKVAGALPAVDFGKSLVVTATTQGSVLNLRCTLMAQGNLEIGGMATRDLRPGFRYVIAVVPNTGVKTVNGKPLPPALPTISGTVEFDGPGQFTKDTIVSVKLQDVSLMDAPAVTLGEFKLTGPTKFPIPFQISYDPAALKRGVDFAIGVRIETNGKLNYINDTRISVLGRSAPPADQPVKAPVKAVNP
jgi:uncharacterized lipoprotein YbaY